MKRYHQVFGQNAGTRHHVLITTGMQPGRVSECVWCVCVCARVFAQHLCVQRVTDVVSQAELATL